MYRNKNTIYQDNIPGKRKTFLLCRPLYFSSRLQPCFPKGKKSMFYYIYRNTSITNMYIYLCMKVFLMYFSPRNPYICTYMYHSKCMNLNICDSWLDLKMPADKVHGQPYLFQFLFFLRESRHMITSPTTAASRSYHVNSDNLT